MNMPHVRRFTALLALAAVGFLSPGCGGGGGPDSAGGGIGGTGLRIGEVSAIGSIVVDDIDWNIDTAAIAFNGNPGSAADMKVGHVAKVEGSIGVSGTTGVATFVEVEDIVKGTVEAKIDANNMVVQGQMVQVDETTIYEAGIVPASLAGITVGDFLEIYGFVRGNGVVFATRIEDEDTLTERRVTGFVQALNLGAETFSIGTQVVVYATADTSDLPGNVPADGMLVRVEAQTTLGASGELNATVVETEDLDDFDDKDDVEVEGFVTAVLSATQFQIGSQLVETSLATDYEGGTVADVVVGAKVEAEGALTGVTLFATKVKLQASVRVEADIDTVGASSFTLVGLPGIVVNVDGLTEYEDNAASFGDLQAGEHVEVRARLVGGTTVVAARVKETGPDTGVELQGPIDAVPAPADPTFSILGILIDTTGFSDGAFEAEDVVIGRAGFFAQVVAGSLVKVEGELVGGVPAWDEVELEDEDD